MGKPITVDLRTASQAQAAPVAKPDSLGPARTLLASALSLVINGLCPFLVYTLLEPHFAKGAIEPLVYASAFPAFGLLLGIVRRRVIDMVAVLALLGIGVNIAAALLAPSIKLALVARSLTGLFTAGVLLISALVRKPLFYYVARQFVAGSDPARLAGFDAANAADGRRTFTIVTLSWALGVYALSTLNATLAFVLPPANYLLASQITGFATIGGLIVWTTRFTRRRLVRRA